MKRFLPLIVLGWFLAGCSQEPSPVAGAETVMSGALTTIPDMARYALAEPIQYENVTIVPVVARELEQGHEEYVSLVEAKNNGWIEIIERPGSETVNRLAVRNTGSKPILLLGGELLLGGKQDRIVAKDTVVPAGKEIEVDVFCVEHGRWSGEKVSFEAPAAMAPMEVRDSALYEDQSRVWENVDKFNSSAGVQSRSKTVQSGLQSEAVRSRVTKGANTFSRRLAGVENAVGIIVVINGEVRKLELFGSPSLLKAASEPLLKSVLAQAALGEQETGKQPSTQELVTFLKEVLSPKRMLKGSANGVNTLRFEASGGFRGVEIGGKEYDGRPAQDLEGLIHGSYSKQ